MCDGGLNAKTQGFVFYATIIGNAVVQILKNNTQIMIAI